MNRRQSLAVLGAGGLALVGYRIVGGGGMTARGLRWPVGATPEITPTEDFYQVSKNFLFADPQLDVASWRLDVRGRLARPLSLSLQDLRAMPAVEQPATLACIGNSVPARAIGNAMWTGVRLATVLEAAGLETDRLETGGGEAASGDAARRFDVVFTGADNYTDSIPLHRVLHPGTLLAFDMNGAPLARGHGAPLRAIVPGIYGMKNVKWIEAIEIVSGDYLGYWQQRGWSEAAPYQTLSRIDQPRDGDRLSGGGPHRITGVAFSGDRGISALEVLIGADASGAPGPGGAARFSGAAGATAASSASAAWTRAALKAPMGPYCWVLWAFEWQPPRGGEYVIQARAVDGQGVPQVAESRPSFPDGATGLHAVHVVPPCQDR